MVKKFTTSLVLARALACAVPALAAGPSPHDIYEAARAGHLDQAQAMMNQVLREHPQSGEAHFVAAELYAREGNLSAARSELATAETLAPGLPFEKPSSVQRLQAQLAQGSSMRTAPHYDHTNSVVRPAIPWGFILLVVGIIAVIWAIVRRRNAAAMYQQYGGGAPVAAGGVPPGYGPPPPGYGPGYGAGPGIGSGIAGGLATGLAVGAGVVAGEELAHRFLDGDREGNVVPRSDDPPPNPNADMGGNDFGLNDGGGSWDDNSGGDDFGGGGGGDDWT
jgi:hypothetical protein